MSLIRHGIAIAIAAGCAGAAWGFSIEPGLWKTTTTMTSPMMPQGKTETRTKCVTKEEAAQDFLATLSDKDSACTVTDRKESGDTLEFTMSCPSKMGAATAKGSFTSKGDTGSGKMEMTMNVQGTAMTFTQRFDAQRVGPCD